MKESLPVRGAIENERSANSSAFADAATIEQPPQQPALSALRKPALQLALVRPKAFERS